MDGGVGSPVRRSLQHPTPSGGDGRRNLWTDRFERFVLLRDYIRKRREGLDAYNREKLAEDPELLANARRLTNLGTLREYIRAYLEQRPDLHKEGLTFLVRQLAPGPEGVPLEIYVFTKDTAWVVYEGIQADIFDHILAIIPEFGLRVFQNPTGHDLAGWASSAEAMRYPSSDFTSTKPGSS